MPSTAASTPSPTLKQTSLPPCAIWSLPTQTGAQIADTKESHPPRDRSRKKYLTRPPPSSQPAPEPPAPCLTLLG
ncbi:hypothetical protein L195_g058502 [Trifolium pratense]|uniref:Uncharacterized protein n=1 Tax=Trifolium pratense TaxID=57577 RepID=A0A2K3JSQ2_TRIPR|nr:hypothetical protein L195_g058502 [Trifolium pratense]